MNQAAAGEPSQSLVRALAAIERIILGKPSRCVYAWPACWRVGIC